MIAHPRFATLLRMSADAKTSRLVVIANRLPVTRYKEGPETRWKTSPGGLVSALQPFLQASDGSWVGWPGTEGEVPQPFRHDGILLVPVGLTPADLENFYLGFSNSTLWPLYHDAVRWPEFHRHWWWPYVEVNARFARAAADALEPGDIAWVHDYQLQLVPALLRELRPETRIGFFLHIPFPPVELFAQLPWRTQLLEGLLGADLVGFQTRNGALNFARAARRFTSAQGSDRVLEFQGRRIEIDAYPISIDFKRYESLAAREDVQTRAQEIREQISGNRKIILGIDRLDYTKGIDQRLRAFETLLGRYENALEDVVFVQVAVPSRELVPEYAQMRERIESQVGRTNGRYGVPGMTPIQYLYRSLTTEELVAYYVAADVMAVTPLRDGMNLVAKEYVAARVDGGGVLVLSEFAGAARELQQAVLVNPHDVDGIAIAFERALEMPPKEQRRRMADLRRTVSNGDVHLWADSFLGMLGR